MFKKFLSALLICITLLSLNLAGCGGGKTARTNYEITASYSSGVVTGTANVEFYNSTENTFKELKFNLFANAFRKGATHLPINTQYAHQAYYAGESYGDMQILSVYSGETALENEIKGEDENILVVTLLEEVFPEESVTVTINYKITLAKVNARTGITAHTVNLANFYPVLCGIDKNGFFECVYYATGDPYFSDCADYEVTFSTPLEYVVASSGTLLSSTEADGVRTQKYSLSNARSFALVASTEFEILTQTIGGKTVNYYYYNDNSPEESLKTAILSLSYFGETFGDFAYDTLAVVETGFVQGGMEFPALVMISDALEEGAYKEVIVHETAHQWWMAGVGNNEILYPFLDEALAEYSVVLFYENHAEYGFTRESLMDISKKTYNVFCSVYEKLFGNVNTAMLRSLGEYTSEYEYVNVTYVKGAIMFDELRKFVGDEKFFKALKDYYEDYCYKNACPDDLISVFERYGKGAEGFINGFLEGKVIL